MDAIYLIFFAGVDHLAKAQHFYKLDRSANTLSILVAINVFIISFDVSKFIPLNDAAIAHAINWIFAVVQAPAAFVERAGYGVDAALDIAVGVCAAITARSRSALCPPAPMGQFVSFLSSFVCSFLLFQRISATSAVDKNGVCSLHRVQITYTAPYCVFFISAADPQHGQDFSIPQPPNTVSPLHEAHRSGYSVSFRFSEVLAVYNRPGSFSDWSQ